MIGQSSRAALTVAACGLLAGLASGCAQRVVSIKYAPLINTFQSALPDLSKPTALLMTYCLVAIENKDSHAVAFAFDPARIFVQPPNKLDVTFLSSMQVAPGATATGSTVSDLGTLTVIAPPDTPHQSWLPLYYTPVGNDSVAMVQLPANPVPLFDPNVKQLPDCPLASSFN
jgi:hypothetical protein